MSILALVKVTTYGHISDKDQVISDLQDIGCLHLISLNPDAETSRKSGPSSEAREALRFLQDCPRKRRQVRDSTGFDPVGVEIKALDLKRNIKRREDERDFLLARIEAFEPWGYFTFPPVEELGGYRLWFYLVPHHKMKDVEDTKLVWEQVQQDNRFCYVAVISKKEPQGMPVPRVRVGNMALTDLERRLEEVELELEDLEAERASLTRWNRLFARSLARLEDLAAREEAAQQTYDEAPLFALQAWAPETEMKELQRYAKKKGLVIDIEEPAEEDSPPTLMKNTPRLASGQDLVLFYMTPGYRTWDPSTVVFFSFALFFAMILSDAGYAALMGLGLLAFWKRMGHSESGRRWRILLSVVLGTSVVWGMLVGSYFGLTPQEGNVVQAFSRIHVLDLNNYSVMMYLSILLGVGHLIMANVGDAWCRRQSLERFGPIGWIAILAGGALLWLTSSATGAWSTLKYLGILLMIGGAVGVLWFTTVDQIWWKRLLGGLQGVTKLTSAFGDTLSYLRLFALGLAGASLSMTFNDLGAKIDEAIPGIGMFFAIIIIVFGHSLNLILSISSGVIHGLRLNFIEFFNWSLPEEGYLFRAFARKEKVVWKE
jgi:V/A-type H+-transporting ATPase subunit I